MKGIAVQRNPPFPIDGACRQCGYVGVCAQCIDVLNHGVPQQDSRMQSNALDTHHDSPSEIGTHEGQ